MNFFLLAVVFATVMPIITFGITYAITYMRGDLPSHLVVPFLSLTINKQPEAGIGALGLSLSCVALFVTLMLYVARLTTLAHQRRAHNVSSVALQLRVAQFFGILSICGILGVGAFQYEAEKVAHGVSALACFGGGTLFALLAGSAEWRLNRACRFSTRGAKLRILLALLALVCFVPFVWLQVIWHGTRDTKHPAYWSRDWAAVAEILMAAFLFSFFSSLAPMAHKTTTRVVFTFDDDSSARYDDGSRTNSSTAALLLANNYDDDDEKSF